MHTPFESQTFTVRSLDAEYSTPFPPMPPPAHLTMFTLAVCPPSAYSTFRVVVFHTLTVPSLEELANRGLAALMCIGSHASDMTHFECPRMASPSAAPVLGSQSRTCPSCPPVARRRSRPSHSTQSTQPLCPSRLCEGVSVLRSQSLALQSPEPVASLFPVGEKAAQRMGDECPG